MPLRHVVAALAIAFLPAAPAAATSGCVATATPPRIEPGQDGLHATGYFGCAVSSWNLYVEVCIEELIATTSGVGWVPLGCSAAVLNDGGTFVSADVSVRVPLHSTFLRATATGSNDRDETATGSSVPVPWVNCACYIG